MTIKHIIITEVPQRIPVVDNTVMVMSPQDYIFHAGLAGKVTGYDFTKDKLIKVINLCHSYEYMSKGYYCSLMAEARAQRCMPSTNNIITLKWKRLSHDLKAELDTLLAKQYKEQLGTQIAETFLFIFGRSEDEKLEFLSRKIFDELRFPLLSVELKHNGDQWVIGDVEPLALKNLPQQKQEIFEQALQAYTGKVWRSARKKSQEKFWLGVLYNPKEVFPPSDKAALSSILRVAKKKNVYAELITKDDMSSLLEYDALFIRETTAIDHHTYRFAYKAESEGIPAIDDTASIARCSNKVFLYELMRSHNIAVPETILIDNKSWKTIDWNGHGPFVLKVPDGSFSKGVVKVDGEEEYKAAAKNLFKRSDVLLMQEFMHSDFDWRIGVLGGKPLFACRYYMAEGHWQIYNHSAKTRRKKVGYHQTLKIEDVPKAVLDTALKAARAMGDGLYGVDLKENERGVFVIEINDNPNIDKGVEDQIEGDLLYEKIIDHFDRLVNL